MRHPDTGGIKMKLLYFFATVFICLFVISPRELFATQDYTVRQGDNLYVIAKKFKVSTKDIMAANNLISSKLSLGTKLTIPSKTKNTNNLSAKKSLKKNTLTAKTDRPASKKRVTVNVADKKYYSVKKGDTLASISKKHSIALNDLMAMNNLKRSSRLSIGQNIALKKTEPRTYTAKEGDTLSSIATELNLSVDTLEDINQIDDSEDLIAGQKILLEPWESDTDAPASQEKIAYDIKVLAESPELDTKSLKERSILFAEKMLNIPYRFGGSTLMGIDCSAYVQKVFSFLDMPLPRTAREQFHLGEAVKKDELSVGDLVFFRTYASFPSHVGIYLGNNMFIHASSGERKVSIARLNAPYFARRYIGAKRLLPETSQPYDMGEEKREPEKEG